jgi:hypothetical protein
LAGVLPRTYPFGAALLLSPERGPGTLAALHLRHVPDADLVSDVAAEPSMIPLPLFAALARMRPALLSLPAGTRSRLSVEVSA